MRRGEHRAGSDQKGLVSEVTVFSQTGRNQDISIQKTLTATEIQGLCHQYGMGKAEGERVIL